MIKPNQKASPINREVTIRIMFFPPKISKIALLLALFFALGMTAFAQFSKDRSKEEDDPERSNLGRYDQQDFCKKTGDQLVDEMRIKQCIKEQQRQYNELIENGQEAANLSGEVQKAFEQSSALSAEDEKKLERLEK